MGVVVIAAPALAWIGDDALITLRTALNLTNGWGPGFNVTEAVQAYTHPLWFLLWVGIGTFTEQWILGILFASVALTGLAVALLVWRAETVARIILATGLLVLSNAFIEYATSGLENPLAYALIGLLMVLTLGPGPGAGWSALTWAALVGLGGRRPDPHPLRPCPAARPRGHADRLQAPRRMPLVVVGAAAALVPLAIWFTWSWATYSTVLPNTFEAKRNLDIPQVELVVQGFRYLWVTFEHDPVTLIALLLGTRDGVRRRTRHGESLGRRGCSSTSPTSSGSAGTSWPADSSPCPLYVAVFLLGRLARTSPRPGTPSPCTPARSVPPPASSPSC